MPRVVHVVTTRGFAGVERYVTEVALETARRGWDVVIIGGDSERVPAAVGTAVRWELGATPIESVRSVVRVGRSDIVHTHMTVAEAIAVATRPVHRAPVVTTRHFAAHRGRSRAGRLVAPLIAARLAREIAVGEFVAQNLERRPASVLESGVTASPCLWDVENRVVLVLQRLEAEKDTATALRAWDASQLFDDGWVLRVVGDGSQRQSLEEIVASESIRGVAFTGWTDDVADEFTAAGIFLASAPAEPFGLAVLEAMSAGVPVAACAAGGHLETVGLLEDAVLFAPQDVASAAKALRVLASDATRTRLSVAGRRIVADRFSVQRHVDRLLAEYALVRAKPRRRTPSSLARGHA